MFNPKQYNSYIGSLRQHEYPSLQKTTYLDHAGTTLYSKSLIDAYHLDLTKNLYGNPHSQSPASWLSTSQIDVTRQMVLDFFQAKDYDIIFTANTTASTKIIGECFQNFWFGYHIDSHNSIVGLRELATSSQCFESIGECRPTDNIKLYAFPAQSNMTGYRPPIDQCPEYTLLDAASYLTTGRLNLSEIKPDFVVLSFYKIFGFPDLGGLLIKKSSRSALKRRYFAGGTIDMVTVDQPFHELKPGFENLEDGTLPFHNIIALKHAIEIHNHIFGPFISQHTQNLAAFAYQQLINLKHSNGKPIVKIYQGTSTYGNPLTQGPIIAFNLLHNNGSIIGKSHVERHAIASGFQLRTGGVCNPGGVQSMLSLKHWEMRRNLVHGVRCGGDIDSMGGKPTGIIRISFGPMSTMSDIKRFVNFIKIFTDSQAVQSQRYPDFTPIVSCPSIKLQPEFEPWNRSWLIVNERCEPIAVEGLQAEIDVNNEKLVLRHSGSSCKVSLWTRGERSNIDGVEVWKDEHLQSWLQDRFERPCTLLYRFERTPEADETCCIVSGCRQSFPDRDSLSRHYQHHGEQFHENDPLPSKSKPAISYTTDDDWQEKSGMGMLKRSWWKRIKKSDVPILLRISPQTSSKTTIWSRLVNRSQ